MEKPPLTNKKSYDILLYCISMDKSPLSAENFNKMSGFARKIRTDAPEEIKFIKKITFAARAIV